LLLKIEIVSATPGQFDAAHNAPHHVVLGPSGVNIIGCAPAVTPGIEKDVVKDMDAAELDK
jgi:hypothetical protein